MHTPIHFDTAVIGAGVVGIAIARRLALLGATTVLLESQAGFGTGISARSSEVIHAGIYYPAGTHKSRFCVAGNAALYRYCAEHDIPHRRTGKLVVAVSPEELDQLSHYQNQAEENGVPGTVLLDQHQLKELEPELKAIGALLSPSTGIVDSHALMSALLDDFQHAGGIYVCKSPVLDGKVGAGGTALRIGGPDPCEVHAALVINSAGLSAQALTRKLEGFPQDKVPPLHHAIGHYYTHRGHVPFRHLIYPVASAGGLGIHLTLDLAGQARFGPDISWRDSEDYAFDDSRRNTFLAAIRRYWPDIGDGRLAEAYTGIRPKLWGPAHPEQDFILQTEADHGIAGLINLFGIESPGLTSALAIADHIATLKSY